MWPPALAINSFGLSNGSLMTKPKKEEAKKSNASPMKTAESTRTREAQRRFERAVDAAVKSGPIHRKPEKKAP